MIEDYQHPNLRSATTKIMQLDVYLPKEHLAFEYQGQQHYYDIYAMGNLWVQKERDEEKRASFIK